MNVFSIGYQGLSIGEYVEAVSRHGIGIVLDVRETPWSYKRGFSKKPLSEALTAAGIAFVRELAAKQHNFTIPPPYVLWLLLRVQPEACLVAEKESLGAVGYLLSVPIQNPKQSLFVWQMAASREGARSGAVGKLIAALESLTEHHGIRSLIFSAIPGTSAFRAIRKEAAKHHVEVIAESVLPGIVAPGECEFRIDLTQRKMS